MDRDVVCCCYVVVEPYLLDQVSDDSPPRSRRDSVPAAGIIQAAAERHVDIMFDAVVTSYLSVVESWSVEVWGLLMV